MGPETTSFQFRRSIGETLFAQSSGSALCPCLGRDVASGPISCVTTLRMGTRLLLCTGFYTSYNLVISTSAGETTAA